MQIYVKVGKNCLSKNDRSDRILDYKYFGVQDGDGCFCGNDDSGFIPAPDMECNRPCSGNQIEVCGAAWRLNVYALSRRKRDDKDFSCLRTSGHPSVRPVIPNPEWLPPNDCCGDKPYNTEIQVSDKHIGPSVSVVLVTPRC